MTDCQFVQGMHSVGMAHMDVKAENIYVAVGGGYRLGDFGLAASEEMLAKGARECIVQCARI